MNMHALTQQAAAELLGVTPRTLRDWEKAGGAVPRNANGTYSAPALVAWFVARERGDADALDSEQERARKDKETADKLAMENALRRGELIEAGQVERAWLDLVLAVRGKLLSLPSKIASQLVNIPNAAVIAGRISEELADAMREISKGEHLERRKPDAPDAKGARKSRAAAGINGRHVGGQGTAT
jgi:phage terminase Nu1 subunit (DNA packaging protein)